MINKIKQFFSRFREETELIKECNRKTPLHRKLSVLVSILCVFLMIAISCFSIPSSAEESDSYTLEGHYVFNKSVSWPVPTNYSYVYHVKSSSVLSEYVNIAFDFHCESYRSYGFAFSDTEVDDDSLVLVYSNGDWVDGVYRHINVITQSVNLSFYTWFTDYLIPVTDSSFVLSGNFLSSSPNGCWSELFNIEDGKDIYFLSSVDNLEGDIISTEFSYNGSLYYGIGCLSSSDLLPSGSLHAFTCVSGIVSNVIPSPYTLEFDCSVISGDFLRFLCTNFDPVVPDSYNPDKPNFQLVYSDGFDYGFMLGLSAGVGDGYNAGYKEGLTQGTSEGYDLGYSEGLTQGTSEGYDLGFEDGRVDGYELGYSQGCSDTEPIAYESGRLVGYSSGLEEGYANGYADGVASSNDSSGDGSDGSADSFDYESVYEDGYTQGYSDGRNSVVSGDLGSNLLSDLFSLPENALSQVVFYQSGDVVISLWSVFSTIVVMMIAIWVIKLLGGG